MKRWIILILIALSTSSFHIFENAQADIGGLKEVPASLIIYVPAKYGKLERRIVKGKLYDRMPTAPSTYASVVAEKSLPILFRQAHSQFPKGTKITQFPKVRNEVMFISLSKDFLQPGFWNNKNNSYSAVYAIVNTAAQGYSLQGSTLQVLILINGKSVRNLANVDLRKPFSPLLNMKSK